MGTCTHMYTAISLCTHIIHEHVHIIEHTQKQAVHTIIRENFSVKEFPLTQMTKIFTSILFTGTTKGLFFRHIIQQYQGLIDPLVNIVATHAYIDDHSGIVPHTCSATSMCTLHTYNVYRSEFSWWEFFVLPWILELHACCRGY